MIIASLWGDGKVHHMNWSYTKRQDGKIAVTLDNNVWDFLFLRKLNLSSELPPSEFVISITREVEIERMAIKDGDLRDYISETIDQCSVRTTSVFGFYTPGLLHQRHGGWGHGTWQSKTEREFYDAIRDRFLIGKKEKGSTLTENEGDAAVAAQSFFSIVLTCETPGKQGPLRFAAEHGGRVLYLPDFDKDGLTLKDYITAIHAKA
jgi:hypothetical protein